ncbi:DUF2059 domain-containing protein [Magnetococcus sp. PR-3]|uniref:DUF2059 domain-containing protein n=1 Tax=Magnetococcus sp. PR-3 TaxID=3120355 RepID=UPI002FCDEDAE
MFLSVFTLLITVNVLFVHAEPRRIVVQVGPSAPPSVPDTPKNREKAATKYAKLHPVETRLNEMIQVYAEQLPEHDRLKFHALMQQLIDKNRLQKISVHLLVKHFTTMELRALVDFYGSAEGRSILNKLGPFTTQVEQAVKMELRHALDKLKQEQHM